MSKKYHNYPIGSIIYPRSNDFQELMGKQKNWDGVDHTNELFLKPCKVFTSEYLFVPTQWYFEGKQFLVTNVIYKGGIYRVAILEGWDMREGPHWTEHDDFI